MLPTQSAAEMAASTAEPPFLRISLPMSEQVACSVATAPVFPFTSLASGQDSTSLTRHVEKYQ